MFFSFFLANYAEARSGCCSHHDGVCGCGCCDGTPLSATCAPYYPSCNEPVYEPEHIEETSVVEEDSSDIPVYKAAAVMSGVEVNKLDVVSPTINNNQANSVEVREVVPLTDVEEVVPLINETKQTLKLDDNIKTEQASSAPVQSNQISTNENKTDESDDDNFWNFLLLLGLAGFITYSVKKKRDKKMK